MLHAIRVNHTEICCRRTSGPLARPITLSPRRRAWWSEDLHAVSRRDGGEPLQVRRTLKRWRQNTFGGGLTDLSEESLELKRLEANQSFPSIGRLRNERVGHSLWTERKRTGRQGHPSITDIEGELAI